MLNTLYIKNFILIDELSLDFKDGFSVFTGETGAGKSIFIDAIGIICGDRFTTQMIKNGSEKAIIEGEFSVTEDLKDKLIDAGYDDESLIITREVNIDGKSVTRINHRPATVGLIKELFTDSIDIHSQHDNQYLLNDKYHLALLDSYCGNEERVFEVKELYKEYAKLNKQYNDLLNNEYSEAQIEMVRYQINEIEKADLKVGELEEIEDTLRKYAEREKIEQSLKKMRDLFDTDNGILANLYEFTRISSSLEELSSVKESVENINNAYYVIDEEYANIVNSLNNNDIDISTIDDMNNRIYEIQRMKRKYNGDVEDILAYLATLREQVKNYDNREDVLSELNKAREEAFNKYEQEAVELRKIRQNGSKRLEKEIVEQLQDLNLENAQFKVDFKEIAPQNNGIDGVCFLISMNPGQPLRPLSSVASGGELSRLMLGLKTIFSRLHGTKLIIFDEIDSGVSGYVAYNIGRKMYEIAQDMQVFSVTHLASVAAWGDNHYNIAKFQENDNTTTTVNLLQDKQRIEELAVLSTSNNTEASLQAADELLNKTRGDKNGSK